MPPEAIFSALGGVSGGTAVVMLVLFITGQIVSKSAHEEVKQQRDDYKRALDLERARSEAGVVTGQIVRDVMTSLRQEAQRNAVQEKPREG